jgi:hypothetical protein
VSDPVPANDHIDKFLGKKDDLWTYYCSAQCGHCVSNRFFCNESLRTRVIGYQLYKYNITGFLHWGYNFYYTRYSKRKIDPYVITDGDAFAPAGDAFSVYPAPDNKPYRSLRLVAFKEALDDLSALTLAEERCGREAVLSVVDSEGEMTFASYPRESGFILDMRETINRMIENA